METFGQRVTINPNSVSCSHRLRIHHLANGALSLNRKDGHGNSLQGKAEGFGQ